MASDRPSIKAVVFDLGGVLIDWDARYLYRSMLPNDGAIDEFLSEVGLYEWNTALDSGRDWDEAVAWLAGRYPERRELIEAFRDRWEETLGTEIRPVVDVLEELRGAGVRTFALSNWSRRTFDIAAPRFPFLRDFEGIMISGDVGTTKPDERIYRVLLERYGLPAARTVFIDDHEKNVAAARRLGVVGIRFTDAQALRARLFDLGLPVVPESDQSRP